METCLVNLVEPGDTVVVGVNGVFGERMCEVARRAGADVVRVEAEWGTPIDPQALLAAHAAHPEARVLGVVHAETSTGVENDVASLRPVADTDTLLLVDAVTSLAGIPVHVDEWGVDACYSGTQKCLGVPPGLSPVTFSARAVERITSRATPVQSWYLDLGLIGDYVGTARKYHHTAPTGMIVALHAGLGVVLDEGLDAVWKRHLEVGRDLQAALEELGFWLIAPAAARLPQLTSARTPDGVDEAALRRRLLDEYGIEVGGGLGAFAGVAWRIGSMGHTARPSSVAALLGALRALR
jgi:alanine-glyoxylate transaminase/serine-glyoxylate transaminase/serine-pyruvate transaminase